MEQAGMLAEVKLSTNRTNLLARRKTCTDKIAMIDRALTLLDANPAIEELADLLRECTKDRDY